jgi:hypothetical protein
MAQPQHRYLRGYTIDPGFSTQLETMGINEMIYKIKWEDLKPGPMGEYIEVIDYDPSNNCFYDPVDLDSRESLSQQGLPPSEGNAQFHQQFVYTVMMQTIENFEKALGRKIIWRHRLRRTRKGLKDEYVQQLRIYPHAMREANAFYTPEKMALVFGYFEAGSKIQGSNFPGGAVFTCLSPDIIAHETTHAILDSILPRYLENTNPDVPAFHEAFADIVALLQRFSNPKLVEHQLQKTRGRLDEFSLLGELATQFGQALETGRGALRSAIGHYDKKTGKWKQIEPDPAAYQTLYDAHDRGAILVATVFDAFMRLYNFKIQDLFRIATQGTGILPLGAIHPDLVKRLSCEASEIASHLLSVCIRALDYCPPFDITYGSYLRALITADVDIYPADNNNYRVALIEAFRAWGIFPDQVNTLSVYSLSWAPPEFSPHEKKAMALVAEFLKPGIQKIIGLQDRKQIAQHYRYIQGSLQKFLIDPAKQQPGLWRKHKLQQKEWKKFLQKLGVVFDLFTCRYEDQVLPFKGDIPLEVHSVRPAFRIGRDETQLEQVIITLTQTFKVNAGLYKGLKFRGGCTIVLSISNSNLKADYIIVKNIHSQKRLVNQLDYQLRKTAGFSLTESIYESDEGFNNINFEKLHFH